MIGGVAFVLIAGVSVVEKAEQEVCIRDKQHSWKMMLHMKFSLLILLQFLGLVIPSE